MTEEITERANRVFRTLCAALDSKGWHYKKDEETRSIDCTAQGDDLTMEIEVNVDAERQLIILRSHLPFLIPEEKRNDVAIAATIVNNQLVDGNFDYDYKNGFIVYRMTNSFIESDIGEDLLFFMIMVACRTIDDFNDKFLMLIKGKYSVEELYGFFQQ
ncbi:MAG: hypothetical protein IJM71_00265 [Clostridia bacterium]|nr:hypothetical protein [Clostridia bacterium]